MEDLLRDLFGLLQIPSVLDQYNPSDLEYPFGFFIKEALDYMLDLAQKDGFKTKNIDNHVGYIEYGEGVEMFAILCHLDVVPATGNWTNPPFSPIIKNNKIFARGILDDKGPTILAYYALKFLKEQGIKFNKRIRLILGCDEETKMRCIDRYLKTEEMPICAFAPDANFPLIHGEKGISSYDLYGNFHDDKIVFIEAGDRYNVVPDLIKVKLSIDLGNEFKQYLFENKIDGSFEDDLYVIKGKSAHAMEPEKGINAVLLMTKFLGKYINNPIINYINEYLNDYDGKKLGINYYDEIMKNLTMNLAYFNYCQDSFKIKLNFRIPNNQCNEEIKKRFKETLNWIKWENIEFKPTHFIPLEDPLVTILMESYQKITKDYKSKPITIGGGTYARSFPRAVAFGPTFPNKEETAHQVDEYMDLDDFYLSYEIYKEALLRLLTCV